MLPSFKPVFVLATSINLTHGTFCGYVLYPASFTLHIMNTL